MKQALVLDHLPIAREPVRERPSLMRRAVLGRLQALKVGELRMDLDGTEMTFGKAGGPAAPSAHIRVHDERFFGSIALGGSVGAGEAYARGWWTSDNPTDVIRLFVRNEQALDGLERGLARLTSPLMRGFHALRRNTRAGSRRNIAEHYDLSNDFFALMLDETMTYSCGIYESEESTLREASLAKIDRICEKLGLGPDDHLLEIGTGWGALAVRAASKYGARVTTTTVSEAQHEIAARRIAEAGVESKVELLLCDYRDLTGTYDKIVSVEMIEAVGHHYFGTFFETASRLLADDGEMMLQAITITDQRYDEARKSVDFIKRYIFPGCCIPSVTALLGAATRDSDLRLFHMEDITPHYARTLADWRENLFANLDEVRALGMTDEFVRMWEFYLCYCEGAFAERYIGDVQMLLTKPGSRRQPVLPSLTA